MSNKGENSELLEVWGDLRIENSLVGVSPDLTSRVSIGGFLVDPKRIALSLSAGRALGLSEAVYEHQLFDQLFSASKIPSLFEPFASVYSGHQFQVWAGQLGDGRAAYLAQVLNARGERWDIQLKGAGQTPYSRFGDGRAVLRSTIREFLCSEAMAGLGIPTTRALAVYSTGEMVQREEWEPGAILTRLAPSHIRFGHFEHFFHRKEISTLVTLVDHVIEHHFPHLSGEINRYQLWLNEVTTRTANLLASWQAVGFCHGVMNTDNMSILGLTLDYGPFGFLERFDPYWVCNHSDHHGLYAYNEQPAVAHWNLHALALALQPLITAEESKQILNSFEKEFTDQFELLFCNKIGLPYNTAHRDLWSTLLELMARDKSDFTNTFRSLHYVFTTPEVWLQNFVSKKDAHEWLSHYQERITRMEIPVHQIVDQIKKTNPKYVLRNWIAEKAIRAAQDNQEYTILATIQRMLEAPFDEHSEFEEYTQSSPSKYGNLIVSCSS